LKYFKFTSYQDFLKKTDKLLKQDTDVFCYHILKTYLLLHIYTILDNIFNLARLDTCKFITNSIHNILNDNSIYRNILQSGINKYMSNKYHKSKKNNLRMTCLI